MTPSLFSHPVVAGGRTHAQVDDEVDERAGLSAMHGLVPPEEVTGSATPVRVSDNAERPVAIYDDVAAILAGFDRSPLA